MMMMRPVVAIDGKKSRKVIKLEEIAIEGRVEKPADVRGALEEALGRRDELVFLDFMTDKTENVYPMIPAGAGLNEMILV